MFETTPTNIYEKTFAKSDMTDAILVVDEKKLHVNKALLSIHSDYFKVLFNSNFKEKSMEEIEIKDVDFENFATVLSQIQPNPIWPIAQNVGKLLELADQFLLPAAKRHLEIFIMSTKLRSIDKLELADKYELDYLMKHCLNLFTLPDEVSQLGKFSKFSDKTKARIFERHYELFSNKRRGFSSEFRFGNNNQSWDNDYIFRDD